MKVRWVVNSFDFREGQKIARMIPFTAKEQANRFVRLAIGTVSKHDDIDQFAASKTHALQGRRDCGKIASPNQNIDVARVSRGSFISGRHPRCNGISADDRVRNSGLIQGRSRPQQSFAHLRHGVLHSVKDFRSHTDGCGRPGRSIRGLNNCHRYTTPFCPSVRPNFGQPSAANPAEEQSKTASESLSRPKASRCGARNVPAERTGEPTSAVH